MHKLRHYVIEQALIMRHENDGVFRVVKLIDTTGDDSQGIDIQTGISFVENREPGFEHSHLQNLVALFLASGETLIDGTSHEACIHLNDFRTLPQQVLKLEWIQLFLAQMFALLVVSKPQKLRVGNARYFNGILKRHDDSFARALVRR